MNSKPRMLIFALLIVSLSSCNSRGNEVDPQWSEYQDTLGEKPELSSAPDVARFDEPNEWPDYIPDEIPEFIGSIRNVMSGGNRIRIFYQDVTREQIDAYLRELEQQGYQLTYQVYIQEGFPDNSEERIEKGDYDAVDISNGVYHMNISYGEGDTTYDIDTGAFADTIPTPAGLEWPSDLVNVVPKPERCLIEMVAPDSSGGYQVTCIPQDEDVKDDYVAALNAAGYLPRESNIVSINQAYGRDDLDITVDQHSTALVLIEIRRFDRSNSTWPPELVGIIPQPEGCIISNVLATGGLNFMINCSGGGEQTTEDYMSLLTAAGFVESRRMEGVDGRLVSVKFEKEGFGVELLISAQSGLIINSSSNP